MKEGIKKVIAGVTHVRLPCAGCGGMVWVAYSKRISEVRCNDCINGESYIGEMHGTGGGRLVDRRKGES